MDNGPAVLTKLKCKFVKGTDFFGGDLGPPVFSHTPQECCKLCADEDGCRAFGWNDGSVFKRFRNKCWLKSGPGFTEKNHHKHVRGIVSGIVVDL